MEPNSGIYQENLEGNEGFSLGKIKKDESNKNKKKKAEEVGE